MLFGTPIRIERHNGTDGLVVRDADLAVEWLFIFLAIEMLWHDVYAVSGLVIDLGMQRFGLSH